MAGILEVLWELLLVLPLIIFALLHLSSLLARLLQHLLRRLRLL
jgi:hypothetical protein